MRNVDALSNSYLSSFVARSILSQTVEFSAYSEWNVRFRIHLELNPVTYIMLTQMFVSA